MSLRLEDSVNGAQLAKNLQLFFQKWKIPEDKYLNVLGPYASFYFRPENVEIPLDTIRKIAKRIDVKVADLTITDDIYQKRMGLLQRLPGRKSTNKAKKQDKIPDYEISDARSVIIANINRILTERKYTIERQKEVLGLDVFNWYAALAISNKNKDKRANPKMVRKAARRLRVNDDYLRIVVDNNRLTDKKTLKRIVQNYQTKKMRKIRYPGSTEDPLGTGSKAHPVGWNNDRMAMK